MDLHDVAGKVALITGIGFIGEGWGDRTTFAILFARQGAILFGYDISLLAAERVTSRMRAKSSYYAILASLMLRIQLRVRRLASLRRHRRSCMRRKLPGCLQ